MSRYALQPLQLAIDVALVGVAWLLVFWLRFNFDMPDEFLSLAWVTLPWAMVTYGVGLQISRVYRHVWRYIGLPELRQLALSVAFCGILTTAVVLVQRLPIFPRSVLASHPLIVLLLLGAVRAMWRTFDERKVAGSPAARRLLIVGTLRDAADALRALKGSQQWAAVGILSPLSEDKGKSLQNVGVLGTPAELAHSVTVTGAKTALIASPPGSKERTELLMNASGAGVTLLTMPRPDEWLKTDAVGPRRIELEDLLGHSRDHDVDTVRRRGGRQRVRFADPGALESRLIHAVALHGAPGELGTEPVERILVGIEHRHAMPFGAQREGQFGADAAASDDDDVMVAGDGSHELSISRIPKPNPVRIDPGLYSLAHTVSSDERPKARRARL